MAENIEGSAENNILEVEDDSELKRKAMEKYTAFLETQLKVHITISKFIIQLLLIVCD